MSKVNFVTLNILVLTFLVCLSPSGFTAGPCPGNDCPPNLSTIPGTVNCNPNWIIVWVSDNPQQVLRGQSVTLKIEGGARPYDLSVSGNDFWFDEAHTITSIAGNNTGVITLYAGGSACGSATITVSDECDDYATGSVRCNSDGAGVWTLKTQYECKCPGAPTSKSGNWLYKECGKWRNGDEYKMCFAYSAHAPCLDQLPSSTCDDKCAADICNPAWGCTQCVTFVCPDRAPPFEQTGTWSCEELACDDPALGYRNLRCYGRRQRMLWEWTCN